MKKSRKHTDVRRRALLGTPFLSLLLVIACGGGGGAGTTSTGGSSTSSVTGGGSETGGGPTSDAGGDGSTGDAGLQPPEGCDVLTLTGTLKSLEASDPEQYANQPAVLTTPQLGSEMASAQHPGSVFFSIDANDAVGSYPIKAFDNFFYGIDNGSAVSAEYGTPDGGGTAGYQTRLVAVSGTIEILSIVTPHQTEGRVSNVRYQEATENTDGSVSMVTGGRCYWLAEATWNSKRTGGCAPFTANACPDGGFCMPTNAIGDDGLCVTTGTKMVGDGCTLAQTGKWDSDCAPGLRCAEFSVDFGETSYTCHQLCNVRSDNPGCPTTQHCGGGYDVCIDISFLLASGQNGNEIDTVAKVGDDCVQNPTAIYCGVDGRPGTCFTDTGAAAATCRPWAHAVSECAAGESAGYDAYKANDDQSTLFCWK